MTTRRLDASGKRLQRILGMDHRPGHRRPSFAHGNRWRRGGEVKEDERTLGVKEANGHGFGVKTEDIAEHGAAFNEAPFLLYEHGAEIIKVNKVQPPMQC